MNYLFNSSVTNGITLQRLSADDVMLNQAAAHPIKVADRLHEHTKMYSKG